MEASQTGPEQGGEDQREDPAASALSGGDPSQEAAASQLTDEQKEQAESGNATQGDQGEVPSGDPAPVGAFDPDQPVRNAPPTPDEVRQAAEAGRTAAPDATGQRLSPEEVREELEGQDE